MFKKTVAITGISFLLGCALVLGTAVSAYCQCVAAPFLEDFEGGAAGWVAGGTSSTWAFGTPAKTAINSAGSGNNSWVTGALTGVYLNNEDSYVSSPCYDLSGLIAPVLKLKVRRKTESYYDGAVIQVSTDNGATWNNVGAYGSGTNWYNNSSSGKWDGDNGGWQNSQHQILSLAGLANVRFRVAFSSDGSVVYEGFAFDDFEIIETPIHDLQIGASEFGAREQSGDSSICQGLSLRYPTIEVANNGASDESGFQVWYQVDGEAKVYEIFSANLGSFTSSLYTFTTGVDVSAVSSHNITYGIDLPTDTRPQDNELVTSYNVLPTVFPSYLETFEGGPAGWISGGDNNTWDFGTPAKTIINSAASGVNAWVNGGLSGSYLNEEYSYVVSPCYDLSTLLSPIVQFKLWRETEPDYAGVYFDISTDGGVTWDTWMGDPAFGSNWYNNLWWWWWDGSSQGWQTVENPFQYLAGESSVRFRVSFYSDPGNPVEGVAFDDFTVFDPPPYDLRLIAGTVGSSSGGEGSRVCKSENLTFPSIEIENKGTSNVSGFQVWYQVEGSPRIYETFAGSISSMSTGSFTFATGLIRTAATSRNISYGVDLPADASLSDNILLSSYTVMNPLPYPYISDFETDQSYWSSGGSNNTWDVGVVAKNSITHASSGQNAWVTGGLSTGARKSLEDSYVESPCIDMSNAKNPEVKFSYWKAMPYNDKVTFQYSTDEGMEWYTVGGKDTSKNWYNNTAGYWSDSSKTWLNTSHDLADLAGASNVRFRFHIVAGGYYGYEGFAFDNFVAGESATPLIATQLDTAFGNAGVWTFAENDHSEGRDIWVTPGGRIYIGGTYNTDGGASSRSAIWALNLSGSLDPGFSSDGWRYEFGNYAHGHDIFVDQSGRILLSGYREWGSRDDPTMWGYLSNGNYDNTFGSGGVGYNNFSGIEVEAVRAVEDTVNGGYYLTGGQYHNYMTVSKLAPNGSPDLSFNTTGKVSFTTIPTNRGSDVVVDSLGRVLVAGQGNPGAGDMDVIVWRYLADGTLDTSFNGTGYLVLDGGAGVIGTDDSAEGLVINSVGDIFVAGYSSNGFDDDATVWKVLGASGALDTSWQSGGHVSFSNMAGGSATDAFHDLQLDSVGNIWLAGQSTNLSGNRDMCVVKLDAEGNLDVNFAGGGIHCHDNAAGGSGDDIGKGIFINSQNDVYVTGESKGLDFVQATVWKIKLETRTISGTVTASGSPLAGVTVDGMQLGTQTTDAGGHYQFKYVPLSTSYQIKPAKLGYSFSPTSSTGILNDNATANFTAATSTAKYSITGVVLDGLTPLSGINIDGGPLGNRTTDSSGAFSFANVPVGTQYVLTANRDRTIFYPETQTGWVTGNVSHTFVVALHDVTFSDVRVDAVTSPVSDLCGYDGNGTVSVDLYNYGYKAQSGFTVKYQLDGGAWVSELFTDTIEPATSYSYTFTTAADLSVVGDHTVTADTSISPPESSKTVYSHKAKTYSSIPYGVNFEGGSNDWVVTSSGNPLVALGTPAKSTIIGAKSGENALVTGGLGATIRDYYSNAAIVTGPCFDLSAAVEPEFAFHIWWESTPNQDGAVVQVSIDDGSTWSVLGTPQTGENWYNSQSISQTPAGQSMGWSGSGPSGSGAWLLARHMLDEYAGESSVRFRIVYEDYRNTTNDGLAIDNIMVTERQSAPPVPLSILDQSFATGGVYVYAAGNYYPSQGRNVDVSPDGKIYVGGTDRTASGAYSNAAVWAFNNDGTPDVSFNSTGFKAEGGAYPHGHDLFIDSLGKIVMSGYRESGGRDAPTIWRYAANGALDSGFGSGGVAATSFAGLEVESDRSVQDLINGGYLLVGRQYGNYMTLSKLTLAGALDTSFSGDGKLDFQTIPTNMGHDIAVDSLGRIVVVGEGNPGAGDRDAIVWRYLANGTLDTGFNGTGYIELDGAAGTPGNHDAAIAVAIDASDDILVAGNSRNAAGDLDFVIWKLSGADGTLDTTFNGTGVIAYNGSAGGSGDDSPADMLIDGGGNIWIVGESTNATPNKDMCIWKLMPTGVPDSTFNKTGIFCHDGAAGGTYESGQGMAIDSAGRIVITGEASDGAKNRMTVWRLGGTATIAGTVTIQGSGLPLAGAVVSAPGYGSDTTDAAGNYEIRFIAEGAAYTVEAASQNYTFLPASFSGTASGIVTHNFTAVPSVATYSITGVVTDQGSPLAGVTIDGGSLGSVVTAGDGTYSFAAIPVGTSYTLSPSFNSALFFPLLTNSTLTGNATHNFQVIAAHQDPLYTLTGTVNSAGTGLAGVTVNGGALGTTVTDGSGNYSFTAVPANTFYSLTYSASGYTFIPATRSGLLFGNTHHITTAQTATYTVAGSVSNSGSPLSGVVVSGGALGYTVSDLSGNFQFTSVPDGVNYTVALQRQGYTFAPASVSATASGNANHAFTATIGNYLLTGTVLEGGIPLAGVVVTGGAIGNRLTNAAGQFSYALAYGTSYNLSFAKAGTVISPATVSGSLTSSTNLALTATRNLHTVSGHITLSGAGLAGVLVSAGSLGTVITDSSGYYSFSSVPYGSNYAVTPTLSGYTFSPFQVTGTVIGNRVHDFAGLEGVDIDLGQNVSGKVTLTNLEHSPLAGVTVTAGGRSAVTNSLGAYTIELVPPGEHTVSADLSGYVISRELSSVTVTDHAVSDVDFTAYPHVTNPAYAMWNGFLGMINILEIMNTGDDPLTVSLTLFTIGGSGNPVSKTWTVPAMTQRDIIINDLQGFEADTYGMFKVECSHDHFDGRVSLYYPDTTGAADAQYGFAYTEALRDVSKGQTAVMYNSYHPGGHIYDSNNTVYNWLTIANLDESRTKSFTVRRYDMSGVFVTEAHVSVPPLGRRDIDGGHVNPGPNNVGTNIIIPDDSSSPYLANVVRYAEGSNFDAFDYAITLPAERGFSRSIYLPMSVEFAAENFIEVANILNEPVNVHFSYIDSDGYVVADHVINFPALAQRHFNSAGLLLDVQSGYVKISPDKPNSILAQSVFYHRDLGTRSVQTAYASPAREIFGEKLYTTYNSFLNMRNYLRLMNIAEEESQVTYYFPDGSQRSGSLRNADSIQMPETSSLTINLGSALREQRADSYGLVGINTNIPGSIAGEIVRYKELSNRKIEFAIDSPAR